MKTIINFLQSFIVIFILAIGFYACDKKSIDADEASNIQRVGGGDKSLVFSGNVENIEPVAVDHQIMKEFLMSEEWLNLDADITGNAQLDEVVLVSYYKSYIQCLLIPYNSGIMDSKVVVYLSVDENDPNSEHKFLVTLAQVENAGNDIRKARLFRADGALLYDLEVSSEGRISNFLVENDLSFAQFNIGNNGYSSSMQKDCTKEKTWNSCMDCAVGQCGKDWVCTLVCGVLTMNLIACLAGFGLGCAI